VKKRCGVKWVIKEQKKASIQQGKTFAEIDAGQINNKSYG